MVAINVNSIQELLAATIATRGLKQKTAAQQIGLSESVVCRIIQGKWFSVRSLKPIACWCGLTPEELWELLPNPEPAAGGE